MGVNVGNMITLGLAFSNGLIALAGALLAQYQGFADVQMGIGMVVWGLASVIIGESLVGTRNLGLTITGAVMGSVIFRLMVAMALRWGLNPNDLETYNRYLCICSFDTSQPAGQVEKKEGVSSLCLKFAAFQKRLMRVLRTKCAHSRRLTLRLTRDLSSS